ARRVRLYTSGLMYGNVEYKLQFDFAGITGDADLKDAYIGLPDFPLAHLKMGHFKEPFGLEELTSSKYITFLERAFSSVDPARNAGVMLSDSIYDDRMTWAAGLFRITEDHGIVRDDGGYSVTGRVTGLPLYEDNGASLLHLGAAYSIRSPETDSVRLRAKPDAHLADYFLNTGFIPTDDVDILGLESAWVSGPLSLQGEYVYMDFDRSDGSSGVEFDGFYGQVSYFLTGEHRRYKKSAGAFTRTKPKKNFGDDGGFGAWEVAARYSVIDLDDADVTGGKMDNITIGLNWYLNPNTRFMWNYVHSDVDDSGEADILLTRLQVDF
ncbi:MAG: OprO/OprP family phosphate-selective porin, partial [Planctomycetota bacterium]